MASKLRRLLDAFERFVGLPWQEGLSGDEKVWFCLYEPRDERRLRVWLPEFEMAAVRARHSWVLLDITQSFEEWMASHEYREAYFAQPELLSPAIDDFFETLLGRLRHSLDSSDDNTVVALVGSGSLFGITQVSSIVAGIADAIAGRLLVFFPGTREGSNYRLLDARDGWNYRAVPIEATEKGE